MKNFLSSLRRLVFFRLTFLEIELERVRTERDAEIERLRVEVRLLMDTLLKANGLPTIHPVSHDPLPISKGRVLPSQWRRAMEAKSDEATNSKDKAAAAGTEA